jgi:selenocysteine-specific elongation factor
MGTGEYRGRVKLLEGQEILPGQEAYTQLLLDEQAVCMRGDYFIVRNASALFTMGGGLIVDPYPQRHKRGRGEVLEVLMKKDSADSMEVVAGQFMQEKDRILMVEELSKSLQIPEISLKASLESLEKEGIIRALAIKSGYMARGAYADAVSSIFAVLEGLEKKTPSAAGWRKEEIAKGALPFRKETVEAIAEELVMEKRLNAKAGLFSRPGYSPRLEGSLEALRQKLIGVLKEMGCSPDFRPDLVRKVAADEKSFRAVEDYMLNQGELVKITPEYFLLSETLAAARQAIAGFIKSHGGMSPAEARDLLKTSRKYIIPLLEYLDRTRFTRRAGDGRVLV